MCLLRIVIFSIAARIGSDEVVTVDFGIRWGRNLLECTLIVLADPLLLLHCIFRSFLVTLVSTVDSRGVRRGGSVDE